MTTASLGFEVTLRGRFDEAITKVTEALKSEGFGVLTRIDLKEAFREKIGVDFREYVILGACNPKLAHRALSEHAEVGLLLPCNVVVEQGEGDEVTVRITDPAMLFGASGLEGGGSMGAVIEEARVRLKGVVSELEKGPAT